MGRIFTPAAVVAVVVVLAAIINWVQRPPPPAGANAPAGEFSAARAVALMKRIAPEGTPHPGGSPEHAVVRERIIEAFAEVGVTVEARPDIACRESRWASAVGCASVINLYGRLIEGEGPAVILMAHYDSVGAGPGAADDLHGVAIILEIARILRGADYPHPVAALITDEEETGLFGAHAFFEGADPAAIGAVINLEARGNEGPSLLFETSEGGGWLVKAFARAAGRPTATSLMQAVYKRLPNDTDLSEAKAAGFAGVNFAFAGNVAHYHTPLDNIENISLRSVQHQGENMLALVRALEGVDLAAPPEGDAVYFDLWSRALIVLPAGVAAPLAIGLGLLLVIAAVLMARRSQLRPLAGLAGVFLTPLIVVLAAAGGFGLYGLAGVLGAQAPGFAHPWPLRLAFLLVGFTSLFAVSISLGRWVGPRLTAFAVWGWVAVGAVALAFIAPGASVVFLAPLIVGAPALFLAAIAGGDSVFRGANWLGGVALWVFLLPLAQFLETAFGFTAHAGITGFLGLGLAGFAPVLSEDRGAGPGGAAPLVATGGLALAAAAAAGALPSFTERAPLRLNIEHFADYRTGETQWRAAVARVDYLPDAMRDAAAFSDEPAAGLRAAFSRAFVAPAGTPLPGDRPRLDILDAASGADRGRVLRLSLTPAPGSYQTRIFIPDAAEPISIRINGERLAFKPDSAIDGHHIISCRGTACADLEIVLGAAAPTPWRLVWWSAGSPPEAAALRRARPAWATPHQDGDVAIGILEQET